MIRFFFAFFLLSTSIVIAQEDAALLFQAAEKAYEESDMAKASSNYKQAYKLYLADEDWQNAAKTANALGDAMIALFKIDTAILLFQQAIDLAQPRSHYQELGKSYAYLYQIAAIRGQHQEALKNGSLGAQYYESAGDSTGYTQCLVYVGKAHKDLGQPDSAIHYLSKALPIIHRNADTTLLSIAYNYLGLSYGRRFENAKAVEAYLKSLDFAIHSPEIGHRIIVRFNLCQQLILEKAYDRAIGYANEAKVLADSANLVIYQATAQMFLGRIFETQEQYAQSEPYFQKGVDILEKTRLKPRQLTAFTNLINVKLKLKKFESAEQYLQKANLLGQSMGNSVDKVLLGLLNGELLIQQKKYLEAEQVLQQTLDQAIEMQELNYEKEIYHKLAKLNKARGQFRQAYAYLERTIVLTDTLSNRRQGEYLQELEARHKRNEQDRKIDRLNYTTRIQNLELASAGRQRLALGGGVVLALMLAGTGFYLFFDKRRTSAKLSSQNKIIEKALGEKDLLLREIHHRVKNNLQVISSLLSLQSRYIDDPQAIQAINEGRTRVRSMALIHQNLYQQDNLTGVPIKEYLGKLLTELFDTYRIDRERIELETQIEDLILDVDTVVPLGLILNELVSNALKYAFPNQQKGKLKISITEQTEQLIVQVSDNGVGMETQKMGEDLDSFGSRLIRALSNKLEARLDIDSTPQEGTSIHLFISDYRKTAQHD